MCLHAGRNKPCGGVVWKLDLSAFLGPGEEDGLQVLSDKDHRVFCRRRLLGADGRRSSVLAILHNPEHPPRFILDRLAHGYDLRDRLEARWAVRPLEFVRERGRIMIVLEDPGGEPLENLLGEPMESDHFLRLAIGIPDSGQAAPKRPGAQGPEASPSPGGLSGRTGAAHRLRHCVATSA